MSERDVTLTPEFQAAGQVARQLFGKNLQAAREAAHLSPASLAALTEMDVERITAIEAGIAPDVVLGEM